LEEEYEEALASLPENVRQLIMDGYKPSYHKRWNKWTLRKRIYGKDYMVYVPRKFSDTMQIIKAYNMKKKADALVQASDYVLEGKLREIAKDERKPIIKKEIEDAAWMHNLYHDLGKYAFLQLVKYVDWTPDDVKNSEKAFNKLRAYFDTLLKYREQAKTIQELQERILKYEMFATYIESKVKEVIDYINKLESTIQKQQLIIQLLISKLDPDNAKSLLSVLATIIGTPVLE